LVFHRSIGRWALAGLVINAIFGSGYFGMPSALTRLLGRASPLAILIAALVMAVIAAVVTEVASQFSETGGVYLYARTALGPFLGLQVAWFWLLSVIAGVAAGADLFVQYLANLAPALGHGFLRALVITALIAIPAIANYFGARGGAYFSNLLTLAKLLPVALLVVLGLFRFGHSFHLLRPSEITNPGWGAWLTALLLLLFVFGGYEDCLAPMAEVIEPRKSMPFALVTGLSVCAVSYALLQFVTLAAMGASPGDSPLVDTASLLMGSRGGLLVTITVMLSAYGYVAGSALNAPRAAYALSTNGDFPRRLSSLHPRYRTPALAICAYSVVVWLLALSGTFLWVVAVSAGSIAVYYAALCISLIRLRRIQPQSDAIRLPFGKAFSVVGFAICVALLTQLSLRQMLLMGVTALLAAANWFWARRVTRRSTDFPQTAEA
jgi:amino acid transporter